MWRVDDLTKIAAVLLGRGVAARREAKDGLTFRLEGLVVDQEFFPLWELNLPENERAASALDFQQIKARRADGWSEEPPKDLPGISPEYSGVIAAPNSTLAAMAKAISQVCRGVKVHALSWSAIRKQDPRMTEYRFRAMLDLLTELDTEAVLSGAIQPAQHLLLVVFDQKPEPALSEMRLFAIPQEKAQASPRAVWRSLSMN
jgi:hypothetical protein